MSEFDKKISALTSGSDSQAADEYVIARGGANYKITGANIAAAATKLGTIATGVWQGTAIANTYIATGLDVTKLTAGATLPSNVLASSLTSVGTLSSLTVSGTSTLNNTVTITGPNVGNPPLIVRNANSVNSGEILLGGTTYGAKITRDSIGADQDLLIVNSHGGAQGFKFRTGSTTAGTTDLMVLTGSGNLGIGTASPGSPLDVIRSSTSTTALNEPQIRAINTAAATLNQRVDIAMRWEDGTYNGTGGISMVRESATARSGSLVFSSINSSGDATQAMRLDASGNLGLGVTPSAWASSWKAMQIGFTSRSLASTGAGAGDLTLAFNAVFDATDSRWEYAATGDKAGRYSQTGSGDHIWYVTNTTGTAGNAITFTQAMTLDASGNLLVGRTTANNNRLTIAGTHSSGRSIAAIQTTAAGNGNNVLLGFYNSSDTRIAYIGPDTGTSFEINAQENVPMIISTNNAERARITSGGDVQIRTADAYLYSNGTSGGTTIDAGFRFLSSSKVLSFWTNDTEKARITAGGYFKASSNGTYISDTGNYHELRGTNNSATLVVTNTSTSYTDDVIYGNVTTAAGTGFKLMRLDANSVEQFRVRGDGTIFAQNTTVQSLSDVRLKENISDAAEGLAVITALRPVRYDWKAGYGNDRKNQLGFIAQEVEAVFPEAVSEWVMDEPTGEVDEDGKPITEKVDYKTVGPGALIPVLVKAIQELEARIAALEA
jgi:hypothetical protein